ncbi:S1 family peptidase [Calidifontibacter sp. DB0510]|uniref:S1 family peptidase n=1 Tax=Metallococcus carri TaxID=1656884 RepID=A0A967AYQ8_9MICO|nr:S1 family peptidase [Metallococcus carri]NHN54178.1 S1 family peptidase [Metallococcus carri]NOP36982.1 S1 family peptidase [Calidifontibacter sp. DB2511S]
MSKTMRSLGAVTAAVALAGLGAPAAHASTSGKMDPNIVGGTTASNPAYVQLIFSDGTGTYGCTGEAIGAQWVLTAKHCISGVQWMDVYYSNSTTNRGPAIAADRVYGSPYGDVALVHLSAAKTLASYAKMANSYTPVPGDTGTIYGYGLRANSQPSSGLYKATVNVLGSSTDAYGGSAIHVKGVDGASNHGDSGGPLVINGLIVGVCSTGDTADPGANINASSNYANLTPSRSWIKTTSGI